jgi:hypothetical protein
MNVHREEGCNSVLRIRVIILEADTDPHQSQKPNPHNFNEEQDLNPLQSRKVGLGSASK